MQNLKVKAMAAAMAAITAVTPVLSTYTEVFAETVDDYSGRLKQKPAAARKM